MGSCRWPRSSSTRRCCTTRTDSCGGARRAMDAGFGGRDRVIDVARLDGAGGSVIDLARVDGSGGSVFAAMAGIGLDAAVVAAAHERLKRRFGWAAYAMAGLTRLSLPPREFTVRLDDAEPITRRARCVVVANAGLLPGGFTLLPAAGAWASRWRAGRRAGW